MITSTGQSFSHLSDEQFNGLMRLMKLYRREALRCLDAKAYTAGAVMIGAAFETSLIALVHVRENEVITWPHLPKKGKAIKPVLEWRLSDLLVAAKYAGWLPRKIDGDEEFSHRKAARGDYAELLRLFRNLVHPTRYLSDFGNMRMTRKRLDMLLEILGYLGQHLAGVAFRLEDLENTEHDAG